MYMSIMHHAEFYGLTFLFIAVGLSMVIILGAELCTGNFMFLITARYG